MHQRIATGLMLLFAGCFAAPVFATDPVVCIDEDQFQAPPVAPAPVALDAGLPRTVWEGATPPGLDPSGPVLVLVHGLHGDATSWYGDTEYYGHADFYDTAYAAGYKVFMLDLWDAGGDAATSIDNGRLMRDQIRWITTYWGVPRVNVIAHSKGGPDANVAAILGTPIDSIVSLSGAHYGSPLADLAQTSWLDWLADLLGFNDAGTRFLQTGCMDLVRGFLDAKPRNNNLSVFTTAATGWGPLFSALEFGGLYLYADCPAGGDNDGLVCVEHAKHPLARNAQGVADGQHRLVWDAGGPDFELDHDNIRMGNAFMDFFWFFEPDDCYVPVFDSIAPYAGSFNAARTAQAVPAKPAAAQPESTRKALNILRGGALEKGSQATEFVLEPGVSTLRLRVLTASAGVQMRLTGPGGDILRLPAPRPSGETLFRGSHVTGIDLATPAPGSWRLELEAPGRDAYALLASLESALQFEVSVRQPGPGDAIAFVEFKGDAKSLHATLERRRVSTVQRRPATDRLRLEGAGEHRIALPSDGVYNLALHITGETAGGAAFERQHVISLGVAGRSGASRIPTACE